MRHTKERWINKLGLTAHPEGGYYKQTFCSENMVTITGKNEAPRKAGTDIYYLMGSPVIGDFSAWHILNNLEESWHYHYGCDMIIYILDQGGNLTENRLGLGENSAFQVHVPANAWFCAVIDSNNPDDYSLVGCTVYPGFDFKDFALADRETLSRQYPEHKSIIEKYTRKILR